jgi:hypothetical protein
MITKIIGIAMIVLFFYCSQNEKSFEIKIVNAFKNSKDGIISRFALIVISCFIMYALIAALCIGGVALTFQ